METLISYLPLLACGAMILLICIPMMRNMHKGHDGLANAHTPEEVAELREEIARLRGEKALDSHEDQVNG